jgi:hypothetical protein
VVRCIHKRRDRAPTSDNRRHPIILNSPDRTTVTFRFRSF